MSEDAGIWKGLSYFKMCACFSATGPILVEKPCYTLVKHVFIKEDNIMYKSHFDLSRDILSLCDNPTVWPKGEKMEMR